MDERVARDALAAHWREQAKAAWRDYRAAKEALDRALKESKEKLTPVPDCIHSLKEALKLELAALANYKEAVRIFTGLVVHGTLPDENTEG